MSEADEPLSEGPWNLRLPEEILQRIREDAQKWHAGGWADEMAYGPACQCGLSERYINGNQGYSRYGKPKLGCERHPEERP